MTKTEIIKRLEKIVLTAEKMQKAYYFTPPKKAAQRRLYEAQNTIPEITWTDGKDEYTAAYTVQCSAHNVYAKGKYTRNGEKTTLKAIRNSLNRMRAENQAA